MFLWTDRNVLITLQCVQSNNKEKHFSSRTVQCECSCCFIWTETCFCSIKNIIFVALRSSNQAPQAPSNYSRALANHIETFLGESKNTFHGLNCHCELFKWWNHFLISALGRPVFRISQRKQLFLNLILLLLLQICYSVLHSRARARCPTLSRSASVTMTTAMDQTVAPTWLPKGNCSSQAVSVCVASHMSDKHNILAQSSVTFVSLGKPSRIAFPGSTCKLSVFCTWKILRFVGLSVYIILHAYLMHKGHTQWHIQRPCG